MRDRLRSVIRSRPWEMTIISVILLNAVILGLETEPNVMAAWGWLLKPLDRVILGIFVIEISLRIVAFGRTFFRDPWSLFDLGVVLIALVPATGPLQVLRALRVLRVLRLISVVPSLKRVVGGLIGALPGMASIVALLALVFYVSSVIATNLYGQDFPEWFGSIGASAYSLFQIMTLESWSMGIVRPVMEVHPMAWLFFVPFIVTTAFAVLNLFIGVIVSAMQHETEVVAEESRKTLHDENEALLVELRHIREEIAALRRERS